jgi:hypothetical protein
LYEADTNTHQAGLFGLSLEEIPVEDVFIWDINLPAFNVFCSLMTQWRVGVNGATGLDYNVIPAVGKMMGYKQKQINEMFADIQLMENEALITLRENQKDANDS